MTLDEWLANLLEYDGIASQYIFDLLNSQCILGLQLVQISSVGRIDLQHQLIRLLKLPLVLTLWLQSMLPLLLYFPLVAF